MKKIEELAQHFAEYKIYPISCYKDVTPARKFIRESEDSYSDNDYAEGLKIILSYQDYKPTKRGADLPFWGKEYFSDKNVTPRVLIVAQDSNYNDAGSIVLNAHRMYYGLKSQLAKWEINSDFLYMTDARKVFENNSRNVFNEEESKKLLEKEINICDPDLIILLGKSPLELLDKTKGEKFGTVVESGELISILGRGCVVSPYPFGKGCKRHDFPNRMGIATELIKKELKRLSGLKQ